MLKFSRKKMWTFYSGGLSVLLFAVFSSAQINPLKDPEICGRPTCHGSKKFFYKPGLQYTYDYSVSVSTLFRGTSTNTSALQVHANVTLDFRSECDGLLAVTNLKLTQNNEQDDGASPDSSDHGQMESDANRQKRSEMFEEAVTTHPLRFAFNDGQIYELCPDEDETNWVLNFKRGILSTIHNSMARFDLDHESIEEDVRGRCSTRYYVEGGEGTSLIITKEKDLGSCDRRSKLHSMIQSVPYRFRRENDDRLLKSGSTCKLSIDHHIYNDIKCTEAYLFQPFTSDSVQDKDKGASTIVHQRLRLIDETSRSFDEQPPIERRVSLLYDPVPTPKPTSGELKSSRDLVKKLCRLRDDDVQTEFSDLFTKFIHTARLLSQPALNALYNHAGTICPTGKKHVRDALPYLTSGGAVALMADLIIQGEVSERNMHEWMLAVALIARPDDNMLESVLRLLQAQPLDTNVVLAVSTLTYTYCQQHANCQLVDQAADVIQYLESRLINMHEAGWNRNDTMIEHQMLVVLKALSNIGTPSEELISTLRTIISNNDVSMAVRLAGVDCHRRFPCLEHRKYFGGIFRETYQDPELRIAAYLQVMRCPNYVVIQNIRHSLESEDVNQVSSFIWSHLKNLLKSAIPSRVEIQGLLSDADLRDKFSRDVRKYSHNYEGSLFFEQYNIGGSYESNVIFSPSSYIPKFGMFNLTVDLFGESVNLFEIYGRVEGFEHFLESIFGPRGPLNAKKFDKIIPKMRWARETNEYSRIKKEFDRIPNVITHDFNAPRVSFGLKVFGNELKYGTFHGLDSMRDTIKEYNPIDHLKKLLSGKEISYNKAAMFLDTSYVVPTGAGLPLTLNAVGTSAINMKMSGSLTPANFWQARQLNLTGNIEPSVAVDIMGTMSVDAYYATTAIKIKTSVYTSSAVEGSVIINGTKLVSVKFGIPKRTMEIFGAKSELVVMNRDMEEILQKGNTRDRSAQSMCSWPAVDKSIGLKLCMDYYFVNETNSSSSFLLAGPAAFGVALLKSDPTAVTYLMEYQWVNTTNGSEITLIFDTPGSSVRRLLGANLTLDRDSQNLTLLLQSTEGTVLARGKYKNTPTEKYMQLGLDINGQRKFDALLSLEQKLVRNGILYVPKLYLGVNAVRVAEFEGVLKYVTKGGVSQCDVNLKFQTKRLQSKLFGYISRTSASFRSNLKLDYRFANTTQQTVITDFYLQDRSTPAISTFLGEASLITTAYPHYNFNSSLKFQKSAGHVECKLQLNSSPYLQEQLVDDHEQLTVDVYITYRALINSTRFNSTVTIAKNSTDLDMRGQLTYDLIGRTHDVRAMVRYAKGKDIYVTIYYAHPRQTLEYIEARLNVSVPNFKPMLLETRIREKNTKDYNVDISATWFSGHEFTMNGVYADKSSVRAANHHLKMFIQSPSFDEINSDLQYYRNSSDFMIDLKATQISEHYELYLKHRKPSSDYMDTNAKIKYKNQVYSAATTVSLKDQRQISLELHLDQYRNIQIAAWGYSKETKKAAGMEVKWDANRDPDQKLALGVDYNNPVPYNHEANFDVSYPGRTIKGVFNFTFLEGLLSTLGQVAWSPDDAFAVRLRANYQLHEEILVMLHTDLTTPFDEWRKLSFNLAFHHLDNMYRVNGSAYWQQDQHVIMEFFGDYFSTEEMLHCEYNGVLESTVTDIPSFSAKVKHNHNATKVITNVNVTYYPEQKLFVNSNWAIDEDATATNLTGSVLVESPFKGLKQGVLASKIHVTNTRDLRAVASVDIDHKKYTVSAEGHLQKLSRSMLQFNITSPIEKFRLIQGRFGFSEENRHLVAMVVHPTGSLGIEVQFLVRSLSNFNTKFHLGTPIDFLQEILFVGKMQPDEADFRVQWNLLLAGFKGAWHYNNVTDFEYAYRIFTPIEGVAENGVVARLILRKGLDSEFSIQFGDSRLGVSVLGQPQPQTLKELCIQTQHMYMAKDSSLDGQPNEYNVQKRELDELVDCDPFSWLATVKIDTLLYSTIEATVEIDQKGTVYDIMATLTLPHGKAELRNEFDFKDVRTMKNRLSLSTPYATYSKVTSEYELRIMAGHQYLFALDFNYQNGSRWIKTGGRAHYLVETLLGADNHDGKQYNVTLHLHTPMDSFPFLNTAAALRKDYVTYAADFYVRTNKSNVLFNAYSESNAPIVNVHLAGHIQTALLTLPPVTLHLHKNFTAKEHKVNVIFDMPTTKSNKFVLTTAWYYDSWHEFHVATDMQTPFRGMEVSKAIVDLTTKGSVVLLSAIIHFHPLQLSANGTLRDERLQGVMHLIFNGKSQKVELDGTIQMNKDYKRNLNAVMLVNGVKHKVAGGYLIVDEDGAPIQHAAFIGKEVPVIKQMTVSILNTEENVETALPLIVEYDLRKTGKMVYHVDCGLKHGGTFVALAGSGTIAGWRNSKINLEVNTSHQQYKRIIAMMLTSSEDGETRMVMEAQTPFVQMQNPRFQMTYLKHDYVCGKFFGTYELGVSRGNSTANWCWVILENMLLNFEGHYERGNKDRSALIEAFYNNPDKSFKRLGFGGSVLLDNIWTMASNLSLALPGGKNVDLEATVQLPPPTKEWHYVRGKFMSNKQYNDIDYIGKYVTRFSGYNYGSRGTISFSNTSHIHGDVDVEWSVNVVRNYLDIEKRNNITHILYTLHTPKYANQAVVLATATYQKWNDHHNTTCKIFYPESRTVAVSRINFKAFANMDGHLNVTTPFKGFNYTGANFHTETTDTINNRYVLVFWQNKTAVADSKCVTTTTATSGKSDEEPERRTKGVLIVEVPLTTRHIARVDYGYNKMPLLTTGTAVVRYKNDKVLDGIYKCVSERRSDADKDTIHVELQNKWWPVGADYIHGTNIHTPSRLPPRTLNTPGDTLTEDYKWVHIYHLYNRSDFNVSGELQMKTTTTGQNFTLMATQSNQTMRLWTNYDVLDTQFKQQSRIELEPNAWFAYNIDLINKTIDDQSEAQEFEIDVIYPRRQFTTTGSYNVSTYSLGTDVSLSWEKDEVPKSVQGSIGWKRDPDAQNKQEILLEIKHPSFEKNITFLGEYERTQTKLADIRLTIEYSPEEDSKVHARALIENKSQPSMRNISYGLWAKHGATSLDLELLGGVRYRPRLYKAAHNLSYRRTYLPTQLADGMVRINLDKNEIEIKRQTVQELSYLWGRYEGSYPLYTANISAIKDNENSTGEFYLNFIEKLLKLELNLTTDGCQSIHMFGNIPDARSASFDIWEDYDDIHVSDIAYYLRMNHSRLVVSSLRWRPELKQEIKDAIRKYSVDVYNESMDKMEAWRQYIRAETADAIRDIWSDAERSVQGFVDDLKDLRVIEEDLEVLKVYLNESYNANIFYVRNLTDIALYMVDELSIRSHLASLPVFFREVWDVMGESLTKIQKSIVWVIEKIKAYYKKAAEFINGMFQGDSVEHLSDALKQLAEKYDNFIKSLHVAFIQYIEQLWQQTYNMLIDNWHKTLAVIEPTFIQLVHYLEKIAVSTSEEFLDFLYVGKNLTDTPYFSRIANFTHDLDKFYTEITGNDTLSATYKYAMVVWHFVQERFVKVVPFGTELKEVITEIWTEIYELRNLPSVQFILDKYKAVEERVQWFCNRIDLENRLHRFIQLIHQKVTDMKRTALQSENRYREAKTKFIFEPSDGIMLLEQKLPMSWHAFNETPKFEEIPEYRALSDVQMYFSASNSSLSSLYYDYTLYLTKDPHDLLPPFKAQAMIAGSRHFITYDRLIYDLKTDSSTACTYLLTSDFVDGNFSVAISPIANKPGTHELFIVVQGTLIYINVFTDTVRVGDNTNSHLPVQLNEAVVYQEADIVRVKSMLGFELECNLKFDVCVFEVSGWYFGKTAGLWGTMNNEPSDDLLTPQQHLRADGKDVSIAQFAESWRLGRCIPARKADTRYHQLTEDVKILCESLFSSTMSPFQKCFPKVSERKFRDMCLSSGTEAEACTTAVAYMNLCAFVNIRLRIPDTCVQCNLPNGTVVPEGRFVSISGDSIPRSADIVFIVEVKECNADVRTKRRMDIVIFEIEKELKALGITDNRYSLVVFGGSGVFDAPRSVAVNSRIFTDHITFPTYFDNIPKGDGNLDIFNAITYASKLIFRPAVAKTFIMLPCTDCDERNMKLDYTIPHQLLLENDVTLHILMNGEFRTKKARENKIFFGLDRTYAYTRKDADKFRGDRQLRKYVYLPKENLRFCTPLAWETNGTVFSAKKLEKPKLVGKMAQVFAKRVAQSVLPNMCKTCECTAHNSGVSYMECLPCSYPSPANIDYGFDEDEMLSNLQPSDDDMEMD